MLDITIDEKTLSVMLEKAISEKVDEIAKKKYFLTYTELSKYLSISKPLIEERLIQNGLKYYKMGSKYLFKRDEVDEFLDHLTANMTHKNNDFKLLTRMKNSAKGWY